MLFIDLPDESSSLLYKLVITNYSLGLFCFIGAELNRSLHHDGFSVVTPKYSTALLQLLFDSLNLLASMPEQRVSRCP